MKRGLELRPTISTQSWAFVIGASCFALGSAPRISEAVGTTWANTIFFIGSWFFTSGAVMQLLLSGSATVNVEEHGRTRVALRLVWLAAAAQFLGTLLFNVSTGAALHGMSVAAQRDFVWAPNAEGSAAFLISSGFAVWALLRQRQYWVPRSRDWLSVWMNVFGSIAFGVSAVGSVIRPGGDLLNATWADAGTFIGALFFVAGGAVYLIRRPRSEPAPATA